MAKKTNSQVAELVDAAEVSDRFGNKKVIAKTMHLNTKHLQVRNPVLTTKRW